MNYPRTITVADAAWPLPLRGGGVLSPVELEVMTWGTPSASRGNAVLVCHSFSVDAFAAGEDPSASAGWRPWRQDQRGWWDALIGPGKAIDTDRWWVICTNVLGGSAGSTGPGSINPATGLPWGGSFPALAAADVVAAQQRLMDQLDIPRWRLVVGGSLGGVQALTWATAGGQRVERVVAIAAAAALGPAGRTHFREGAQRIRDDLAGGGDGRSGLVANLRAAAWFSGGPASGIDIARLGASWPSQRFHPHSYRLLADLLLRYDLAQDWGGGDLHEAVRRISAEVQLLGYRDDRVFTVSAQSRLAAAIRRVGGRAEARLLPGSHGHDSFLDEPSTLDPWLRRALSDEPLVTLRCRDGDAAAHPPYSVTSHARHPAY